MMFLYENSVTKSMLERITENNKEGDVVVMLSMSDMPLVFGIAARTTQDYRKEVTNVIVVRQI
jgi:60S ribosome subunit biogenesis protein NIP7